MIERAAVTATGEVLEVDSLPEQLQAPASAPRRLELASSCERACDALPALVRAYEIGLLRDALAKANHNHVEAARLLGIPRRTVTWKVQVYRLARDDDRVSPTAPAVLCKP